MSDSRENSPDWLREFQAPTPKLFTLSSASESSREVSLTTSDDSYHEEYEGLPKKQDTILIDSGEDSPVVKAKKPKTLKTVMKKNLKEETHEENPTEEDTNVKAGKVKTPRKENNKILKEEAHEEVPTEEDATARDKPAGPSAPTQTLFTLSPASESSPELSLTTSDDSYHEEYEGLSKKQDTILINSGEDSPVSKAKRPKTLKTIKKKNLKEEVDEEVSAEEDLNVEVKKLKAPKIGKNKNLKEETYTEIPTEEDTSVKARKVKTPTKEKNKLLKEDVHEEFPAEEDTRDEPAGPSVISRLPLVFPEKVQRSKVLVECDGDAIDLSGDVGAVGRIVISNDPSGSSEMLLDLKGNIYKTTIVPSRTFCIVSVGQSEAKIEAIMNDFVQLEPQSNVFEAETMIEGTLDGFSFDSDEGEKIPKPSAHQSDQNVENGKQTSTVKKRKPEKSQGAVKKKVKAAGRPPKAVKKTKMSKK